MHYDDYKAASIPAYPIQKGMAKTKVRMVVYISAFIIAVSLLTLFDYTGYIYLTIATAIGFTWLWFSIKGFKASDDKLWARRMFRFSLVAITALSILIPLNLVY